MAGEQLLIVDDEENICKLLSDRFESMGFVVVSAANGVEGLDRVRKGSPDVVFLDIEMPEMDGFEVLKRMARENLESVVVVITAHGSVKNAVEAMRLGAYDFVTKPFDTGHVEVVLDKALAQVRLKREHAVLQDAVDKQAPAMIGDAPAMREVMETGRRAANSNATVLILGESGTGKEVLAQSIHAWSERKDGPFVAVDCAVIPEQLLESALFGYEKGAFTGAAEQKKGKFELARGGTIFLDEIAEIKPELQVKLLRVLQEGAFERVGGNQTLRSDLRVLAATNRDLEAAREAGAFREDLYYRLNVIAITMPPLRQRAEDIPGLANHFLERYSREAKRPFRGISEGALDCLTAYEWPGNVRELANVIERAVVLGLEDLIEPEDLPANVVGGGKQIRAEGIHTNLLFHEAVDEYKRGLILEILKETAGNRKEAAEKLGLQRTYLARLITNLGMRERSGDDSD